MGVFKGAGGKMNEGNNGRQHTVRTKRSIQVVKCILPWILRVLARARTIGVGTFVTCYLKVGSYRDIPQRTSHSEARFHVSVEMMSVTCINSK